MGKRLVLVPTGNKGVDLGRLDVSEWTMSFDRRAERPACWAMRLLQTNHDLRQVWKVLSIPAQIPASKRPGYVSLGLCWSSASSRFFGEVTLEVAAPAGVFHEMTFAPGLYQLRLLSSEALAKIRPVVKFVAFSVRTLVRKPASARTST